MNRTKSALFLRIAFWMVLLALTACGPSNQNETVISESKNGGEVTLKTGQVLTVRLESNPTTGYSWAVTACDEAVLSTDNEPEFESQSGNRVGAGGVEVFHFKPVKAGETDLTLGYRRPWEKDVEPIQTFAVRVTVE